MEAGEEGAARYEVLVEYLRVAVDIGLPEGCAVELEEFVLGEFFDAFRKVLTGEMPACMTPMRVTQKQGVDLTQGKAKPRVYPPEKNVWLNVRRRWCTRICRQFVRVWRWRFRRKRTKDTVWWLTCPPSTATAS